MKAMARREFLQVAAMLGVGGTAALLGTGCASGSESARAETGADESPAQDEPSADTSTDASATASTAKSDAARGEQIDPPTASIEPAEPWLIDADTTPAISASAFRDGFAQVGITKVDWKTSTVYGSIDTTGRLLYYSDRLFITTADSQGASILQVTSKDGENLKARYSYTLTQDGSDVASADGLSFDYPFLAQEEFSDVTSAQPIFIIQPGDVMGSALNPMPSSYVLVRHQQTGFTSYDRWEIRDTAGQLLYDFEFDVEVTDCEAFTDPSESLFFLGGAIADDSVTGQESAETTGRGIAKVYHRVTQECMDFTFATSTSFSNAFGDSHLVLDTVVLHRDWGDETPLACIISYEDGSVTTPWFSEIGNSTGRHFGYVRSTERNGMVVLEAGYGISGTYPSLYSYEIESGAYHELDSEYLKRLDWTSDTFPCGITADGEHIILFMQGDDELSYVGVFDMAWNLLFDPVRADAVLGEEYDGKFAVGVSMTSSDASFVFYDLDGNVLRTIESSEGIVLRSTFTRTSQGIAPFERTDNPGVLGAIDLTGTILFEGIDVSQARKFVIEESEE